MKTIPFVDLRPQHDEVRHEMSAAIGEILDSSAFVGGPFLDRFEAEFAAYLGAPHAVGVASGTDAVRIALQVTGVAPGDAVITVAHTFIGTTEGVSHIGALPLFVDVEPASATMSPAALTHFLDAECRRDEGGILRHRASGSRIGAILPVHLYGQSADMAPILAAAARYGVPVVEDAAQAQGARYRFPDGREMKCGTMGEAAAFSFDPGKNLGAIGEAGAVVVRDGEAAQRARMIRDHGQSKKYVHQIADGTNARLDAIQAAVLSIKLRRLDRWNDSRRSVARAYDGALGGRLATPTEMPWAHHVYHLYVIQVSDREGLRSELARRGIGTGMHYPIPLHRQPAFAGTASAAVELPVTERLAATCLSLPMYPHMTGADAELVSDAVVAFSDAVVAA